MKSAAWRLALDTEFTQHLRAAMSSNLDRFAHNEIDGSQLHRAAVCIAVLRHRANPSACFLLTRRASTMSRHSGQYALPGGRVDTGESTESAALRELEEELGIPATQAQVIGRLDDYATRSGFRITPIVAWIGERVEIHPDAGEVDAYFYIPLDDLLQPDIPRLQEISESERPVLSIELVTLAHEVFAPTAAMLYQFREVALYGHSTRVAHFEQPVFAWR
jgi:8-oxo-dGTP pyrophosphatase MutT (NUDIX family)